MPHIFTVSVSRDLRAVASPKVYLKPCRAFMAELDIKKILMINFKKVLVNQIGSTPISFSVMKLKFIL